jgi:hypothetical protein
MTIPWLRSAAWHSKEDIRGLSQTLRTTQAARDDLVFIGNLEDVVQVYWPECNKVARPLNIDMWAPLQVSLAGLRQKLARNGSGAVQLVYRDDGYLQQRPELLSAIIQQLHRAGFHAIVIWDKDYFHITRWVRY